MLDSQQDLSPVERELITAWSGILEKPVTTHSNILEEGANSVHLLLVLNRLREIGLDPDVSLFFEFPVIGEFAAACKVSSPEEIGDEGYLL